MQPAVRYARYVALVWVPIALVAALLIEHPGWTAAVAASGVLVPLLLVVIATVLDPNGPHRPDDGARPRVRRSQARSA
jgi:hypothetical protein